MACARVPLGAILVKNGKGREKEKIDGKKEKGETEKEKNEADARTASERAAGPKKELKRQSEADPAVGDAVWDAMAG